MRKTLLIAAAALAASVISSRAQVYSQNIVGYVNTTLTAGTLANVAVALDADGTGTNNTVGSVFTAPSYGDQIYAFNGAGYDAITYTKISNGARPPVYTTNWAIGSTVEASYKINPGQSVFYQPAASQTLTQVGTALTGTWTNDFIPAAGKVGLLGSVIPVGGGLTSVLGYQPSYGDFVYLYSAGNYTAYTYTKISNGARPPVYTTNWAIGSTAVEPVINVGQGFWLQPAAGTNTWIQNVNP